MVKGWIAFLSHHSFSKTLEHELFHEFKMQHAGFLLHLILQSSAPSRSVSAVLENYLG